MAKKKPATNTGKKPTHKKTAKKAPKKVVKKAVEKASKRATSDVSAKARRSTAAATSRLAAGSEPLAGIGRRREGSRTSEKRVSTKIASVGKKQRVRIPVRTGTGGGRPGGGSTGELSPVHHAAAGRVGGRKRAKR